MKTAIVYASLHHGNTKKVLDEIVRHDPALTLIDTAAVKEADLSGFDRIGIASGVAFGKYYQQVLTFLEKNLPEDKPVFFIHTGGAPHLRDDSAAKAISDAKHCPALGTFCCRGFDTFGPFRLIGGIAKGHPNAKELARAVAFYRSLQ